MFSGAGELNCRVTIERLHRTQAADGKVTTAWVGWVDTWAKVEPQSGSETHDGAVRALTRHLVSIRHREGVEPKMRIRYRNRVLEVEAVRNVDERRAVLELLCVETVQ